MSNLRLPFDEAQGRPFDEAQGRPFDEAQGRPFDEAQGRPFEKAQGGPFEAAGDPGLALDREARAAAVDPRRSIALAASAGTGKTRVLVDRYLNLLKAGVDPRHILAMTFTRKAAAEMRQRIVDHLRAAAARGEIDPARWRQLRDRLGEIAISTIDAFCLALLREFPLEAGLDPGFEMADETEVPRLMEEALDHALRICREQARTDEDVALVFAQLGERRVREGLTLLLDRRLTAVPRLSGFVRLLPQTLTPASACARAADRLAAVLGSADGGLPAFLASGPVDHPRFAMLSRDLAELSRAAAVPDLERFRGLVEAVRDYFMTQEGKPREKMIYAATLFRSPSAHARHRDDVRRLAPLVGAELDAFRRDLNAIQARGTWRMLAIALDQYRRTLAAHAALDFPEALGRAIDLLRQMDEFARSRYLLESRYHHVLVDEFQDTSRAQWELVRLLTDSWREGLGVAEGAPLEPTLFIVGDRKQSIYGFRDADVRLFREAGIYIEQLRPGSQARRSITRSFRAVPALLAFVNDLFGGIEPARARADAFTYGEEDRFPIWSDAGRDAESASKPGSDAGALGLAVSDDPAASVEAVASEIVRLLEEADVRDRATGVSRRARPGDIAVLFRSRESHREVEQALDARGVPTYVYKGLGFFDADEIKDALALIRYLAHPESDLRAAAFLRSRVVRASDPALQALAPRLAEALTSGWPLPGALDEEDRRVLDRTRASVARWLALVDRVPPADLLSQVLDDCAYAFELGGPRAAQARENLKKLRSLVRRIQNRGYATLSRIADHLDRLSAGDESNAVVDAADAVNLMTVHAAKGLEFPIVFLVNLARGTGGRRAPIRVASDTGSHAEGEEPFRTAVGIGDFDSDADADADERDREETKRLLYVAVTRARDRLYLSTPLKEGRVVAAKGSLASVLPDSFRQFLGHDGAASSDPPRWRTWPGPSGQHRFRVCVPEPIDASRGARDRGEPAGEDDLEAIAPCGAERRTAITAIAGAAAGSPAGSDEDRVAGMLAHRAIQRFGWEQAWTPAALRELVRGDEAEVVEDVEAMVARVAAMADRVAARADLRELIGRGRCLYEVPVSLRLPGGAGILRGRIDCLVRSPDGTVTVLDFKTGAACREHDAQLELYVEAARALFPGAPARGLLVYLEK